MGYLWNHSPRRRSGSLSCVFQSTSGAELILEANGIDADGDEVILRREILADGKGRVYVNNQPATVAVLRALAPELALVHAQSETLSGFDPAQQRLLLDRFGGVSLNPLRKPSRAGAKSRIASPSWRKTSRIDCGWPICGAFRRARFSLLRLKPAKTKRW